MTKRADDYYLGAIARANYLGLALAHHNESALLSGALYTHPQTINCDP